MPKIILLFRFPSYFLKNLCSYDCFCSIFVVPPSPLFSMTLEEFPSADALLEFPSQLRFYSPKYWSRHPPLSNLFPSPLIRRSPQAFSHCGNLYAELPDCTFFCYIPCLCAKESIITSQFLPPGLFSLRIQQLSIPLSLFGIVARPPGTFSPPSTFWHTPCLELPSLRCFRTAFFVVFPGPTSEVRLFERILQSTPPSRR